MTEYKHPLPFTKLVSDEVLKEMIEQDKFGLKKYNQPLDPMDNKYDWLKMAQQELADALKYFKAEQVRRDAVLEEVMSDLTMIENHARGQNNPSIYYSINAINAIKLKLMQLSQNIVLEDTQE